MERKIFSSLQFPGIVFIEYEGIERSGYACRTPHSREELRKQLESYNPSGRLHRIHQFLLDTPFNFGEWLKTGVGKMFWHR